MIQPNIHDINITPLAIYEDDRGMLLNMINRNSKNFRDFGEIYFSYTNFGIVKGWYRQKTNISNFVVLLGELKFIFYDDRKQSRSHKIIQEVTLSKANYCLLTVPPMIWYSFKTIKGDFSILSNLIDTPYKPSEVEKVSLNFEKIPHKWNIRK